MEAELYRRLPTNQSDLRLVYSGSFGNLAEQRVLCYNPSLGHGAAPRKCILDVLAPAWEPRQLLEVL